MEKNTSEILLRHNTALNELQFLFLGKECKGDIHKIYNELMATGLDDKSLGFWILDIQNNIELYSPMFRKSLGYTKKEFPDLPSSWQLAIYAEDRIIALDNFEKHIEQKGEYRYIQKVRYRKKSGDTLALFCHGIII